MSENTYIESPIVYAGSKRRLLPQIMPLFPNEINTFVDLFCGNATVSANVKANKVYANDNNDKLIGILRAFQQQNPDDVIDRIEKLIQQFGLETNNKESFVAFREHYNQSSTHDPIELYTLMMFAYNHQMRFNKKGQFNLPVGNRGCTSNKNIPQFSNAISDIVLSQKDFRELDVANLGYGDFVYADPPYLISTAVYNERNRYAGGLSESEDSDLFHLLDELNQNKVKFALSNVFYHKGKENKTLVNWAKNYNTHYLNFDYNNSSYNRKNTDRKTVEVLITNY